MTRSRSRWNAGLTGSSTSDLMRPRESALFAACGARMSRSRCSSCSRILMPLPIAPAASILSGRRVNLAEETGAVRQRSDTEDLGQRLAEIGERLPHADVDAGAHAWPIQQHRHMLPR